MADTTQIIADLIAQDKGLQKALEDIGDELKEVRQWSERAVTSTDDAGESFERFNRKIKNTPSMLRRVGRDAEMTTRGMRRAFRSVAREVAGLPMQLTALATAGGAATVAIGFRMAAEAETSAIAMEVLLKSATSARTVLAEVGKLAAETPYTMPTLVKGARNLAAFKFEASEIPDTLRRMGDIASGVGMQIGELAEIYGKARVAGRIMGEDINQLVGRGIPVITELANVLGVAEEELKDLVSKGVVNFGHLQQAFENMTNEGGTFFGMMERQSKAFSGRLSTLQDNFGRLAKSIGQDLLPVMGAVVEDLIDFVQYLKNADGVISNIIGTVGQFVADREGRKMAGDVRKSRDAVRKQANVVRSTIVEEGLATHKDFTTGGYLNPNFLGNFDKVVNDLRAKGKLTPEIQAELDKLKSLANTYHKNVTDLNVHADKVKADQRAADRREKDEAAADKRGKETNDLINAFDEAVKNNPTQIPDDALDRPGGPKSVIDQQRSAIERFMGRFDNAMMHGAAAIATKEAERKELEAKAAELMKGAGAALGMIPKGLDKLKDFAAKADDEGFKARREGLVSLYQRIQTAAASKREADPALVVAKEQLGVMKGVAAGVVEVAKAAADPPKVVEGLKTVGAKLDKLRMKWGL